MIRLLQERWRKPVVFATLCVIGALLYVSPRWQFFHNTDLTWIRALQCRPLLPLIWDQIYRGSPWDYRPLTSFYLLILYRVFGDWAPGFYGTNLLLHASNAAILCRIAVRFKLSEPFAYAAALLFLVHPAPFRTVVVINDAATILQTHFTLWTILLLFRHFDNRSPKFYAAAILAAIAAMFTKESGVTTVALPPVMDFLFRRRLPLSRLRPYLLLLAALLAYVPLSLHTMPGWREHLEVYRLGPHIFGNLAYTLGFLLTTPHAYAVSGVPWTKLLGGLVLLVAYLVFRDRPTGIFVSVWLLLGALPTAPFVTPNGFESTGRYTYSVLAPFSIAAACLFQRLCDLTRNTMRRPVAAAVWITMAFILASFSIKTSQLAKAPFDTRTGSILYNYVVLALMDYREAERFLTVEIGCPTEGQLNDVLIWAEGLVKIGDTDPQHKITGLIVSGVARAMLRRTEKAGEDFDRAINILRQLGRIELARGSEIRIAKVIEVAAMWTASPPVHVCP